MTASLARASPARLAGFVRRFCECGALNRCVCNRPRPASGWTVGRLSYLRELMHDHGSVGVAADVLGDSVQRCNLALNALLGRTPAHALAALEAAAERRT